MNRNMLSLKLGILSGIIWGLFLASYYTMVPSLAFAIICATVCLVTLTLFVFAWPLLIRAFKLANEEGKRKRGEI
jgi:hypothetical protein